MNSVFFQRFVIPEPHKPTQLPDTSPFYQLTSPQMLSPHTVAASTPSLVARSLTSSPSTSGSAEDEIYRTDCGHNDVRDSAALRDFNAFHFDTDDSTQPWYTGKTLLAHLRHPAASSSSCPPSAVQTSAPAFVPNPHALKYTPTITRKRYAADPTNCERVEVSWRLHHAWLTPLRAGAVCQAGIARREFAGAIVAAGPWDTSLVSELAAKFIERAAEGVSPSSTCVADLAQDVYVAFRKEHGDSLAEIFAQQLKQCLLSEFRAWWLQDIPSSIYNMQRLTRSPPHAHPYRLLSSALAVAEFAGDLFAHSLVAPHYLLLCLDMLLNRLAILEEVCALHAILYHAGEGMYSRLQNSDFISKLQRRAARISSGATSVGHPDVVSEVARLVGDMTSLIEDWGKARATPSPSECSDAFSEYSDHNPDLANYHDIPPVSPTASSAIPATPPGLSPLDARAPSRCGHRDDDDDDDEYADTGAQASSTRTVVPGRPYGPAAPASDPCSETAIPPPSDTCTTPLVRPQARLAERNRSWADIVKA